MLKLILMISLCLIHGIAPLQRKNGNSGDHGGKTSNSAPSSDTTNMFWSPLVKKPTAEIKSRVERASFSRTEPGEVLNIHHGKKDLITEMKLFYEGSIFNAESVLNNLSKNSINENKGDENVRSKRDDFYQIRFTNEDNTTEVSTESSEEKFLENSSEESTTLDNSTASASLDKIPTNTFITPKVVTKERIRINSSDLNSTDLSIRYVEDNVENFSANYSVENITLDNSKASASVDEKPTNTFLTPKVVTKERIRINSSDLNSTDLSIRYVEDNVENFSEGNTTLDNSTASASLDKKPRNAFITPKVVTKERIGINSSDLNSTDLSIRYVEDNVENFSANYSVENITLDSSETSASVDKKPTNTFITPKVVTKEIIGLNSSDLNSTDLSIRYVEDDVENFSVENTTLDNSKASPSLDKKPTNTSTIPKVSFVSPTDSSVQHISNYVSEKTVPPPSKEMSNHIYKLVLTKDCSGDVLSSQTIQLLVDILNKQLNAQDSTKLVKCGSVYEFNFTSDIESRESFSDVIHIIHEKMDPDVEVSIVNYTSVNYDVSYTPHDDSYHFVVPKLVVYISAGATLGIIVFMIFVVCLRKRYKKNSSSLNLSDIPHVALSVDDYKVAPIPRPSISLPETNRDFLYAYSNETYSRTPDEILKQRNFSNGVSKETRKVEKANSMSLEMQSFARKGDVGRNRPDYKSTPDYEYASAGYWDRMKGRGIGKKRDLDAKW